MLLNREPKKVISLGMMFFAIANVGGYLLMKHSNLSENAVDAGKGFLLGAAIATMLLGVWMRGRQMRSEKTGHCL
jgi:hypothetical protein